MEQNFGSQPMKVWHGVYRRVYEKVKREATTAKLYVFSGVQIITANQAQKEMLLKFLEMEEDICNMKLNEMQEIRRLIEGEDEDV